MAVLWTVYLCFFPLVPNHISALIPIRAVLARQPAPKSLGPVTVAGHGIFLVRGGINPPGASIDVEFHISNQSNSKNKHFSQYLPMRRHSGQPLSSQPLWRQPSSRLDDRPPPDDRPAATVHSTTCSPVYLSFPAQITRPMVAVLVPPAFFRTVTDCPTAGVPPETRTPNPSRNFVHVAVIFSRFRLRLQSAADFLVVRLF